MTSGSTVRRALVSVHDKTGLVDLARALHARGVEILSTGGTAKALRDAGLPVKDVSDETGFPEMMDGRVKTLHPKVHGALLALRDERSHLDAMHLHGIVPIDLVVVSLYPFEATVRKAGVAFEEAVEQIDIGGPAMIRSAAKNHRSVGVVTDPSQYGDVLRSLQENDGALSDELRASLARAAFARTAAYDATIARWLAERQEQAFPESFGPMRRATRLRYGENPHQEAALYADPLAPEGSLVRARLLGGKELSYNNIGDADAAWALVREFEEPAAVVVKHANPCGVAVAEDLASAYEQAVRCDPRSAFGGILALTVRWARTSRAPSPCPSGSSRSWSPRGSTRTRPRCSPPAAPRGGARACASSTPGPPTSSRPGGTCARWTAASSSNTATAWSSPRRGRGRSRGARPRRGRPPTSGSPSRS
jgi:phosphoribosylaminoimidazolecarboxamide formyltransferase/IMP cyclohydrolase